MTVEKYSPLQEWDYADPEIGFLSGGAMVFASATDLRIENSTFRYSSAASALGVANSQNSTVSGNVFENNGAGGFGIDKSSNITVENNRWTSNNTSGFNTTSCGAYCTLGDTKITHAEGIRFAHNIVDYSNLDKDASLPENYSTDRRIGVWFDEGVINSQIVGNYFVNVPVAIFNEVSSKNMIASNIVEGAGVGIHVSGSDDTQIWNNTISHALTSIFIQEDDRSKGCNERYEDGSCTRPQPWSVEHGLSWDTTGTTIYNNILSSEQTTAKDGDPWVFSMMMKVTGAQNTDGSGAVYANEMVTGIDYDVYYRHENPQTLSTTVLWNWGADRMNQSVNAEKLSDFTASSSVKASGKEANGLDLHGSPENNPFFVKESANPMDKTSDFHLKEGSPASGNGHALPEDIAKTLGVNANVAVDRGALVNVAWGGGAVPGAGDAPADNANNGDKAANNNGGNANNGGKADNNGGNGGNANNGGNGGNANNGGKADNNGSTVADGAASTGGQDAQSASPSDSKAGAGQKNSSIAKPGGNAQGGQGQAAAAAAATGDSRLPLTGASLTGIVLAVAAIVMGGGFILVRRRMAS